MARIKAGPVDEYISLLDKVQKEAQYQELDYTNTSPFTFYCLAAMPTALLDPVPKLWIRITGNHIEQQPPNKLF